jgi:hypothetical protein
MKATKTQNLNIQVFFFNEGPSLRESLRDACKKLKERGFKKFRPVR